MTIKGVIKVFSVIASTCFFFVCSGAAFAESECGTRPDLSLKTNQIYWRTYSDYIGRLLSIEYRADNLYASDAIGVNVTGASGSNDVTLTTSLPLAIGDIPGNGSTSFTLKYHVPTGINAFLNIISANAEDGCGNIFAYPQPQKDVSLQLVASLQDPGHLTGADGLYLQGDYAYIASGVSNTLSIIDVSDPYNPVMTASLSDPYDRLTHAWGVYVSGNYAYVVTGYSGSSDRLTIVDISNPYSPWIVSSLQDFINLNGALHIDISGNYAYVTAAHDNRMSVIDISSPQNPHVAGSVRNDILLYRADGISVDGDHAYVVSHQLDGGTEKSYLNAIDISDPAHPYIASSINSTYFRGGDQMSIVDDYVYVPGNADHTFSVVDISNPMAMSIVSHITDHSYIGQSCFIEATDEYAFVTSANNNRLTLIDITSATMPQIITSVQDANYLLSALYVNLSGRFAFITSPAGSFSIVELVGLTEV